MNINIEFSAHELHDILTSNPPYAFVQAIVRKMALDKSPDRIKQLKIKIENLILPFGINKIGAIKAFREFVFNLSDPIDKELYLTFGPHPDSQGRVSLADSKHFVERVLDQRGI